MKKNPISMHIYTEKEVMNMIAITGGTGMATPGADRLALFNIAMAIVSLIVLLLTR